MQPVFLFKTYRAWAVMSLAPQILRCCASLYSWSMSEVIDKDTRSSERTDIRIMPVKLHWLLVHEWLASNWQK